MTSRTFYSSTVPTIIALLKSIKRSIAKGKEFAKESGRDEKSFVTAKLADDMFDLRMQVSVMVFYLNPVLTGLYGNGITKTEGVSEDATTFDEISAVIDELISKVEKIDEATYNAKSEEPYVVEGRTRLEYPHAYLSVEDVVMPSLFFHAVTFYDILRNQGVPVGKKDYAESFFRPETAAVWAAGTTQSS